MKDTPVLQFIPALPLKELSSDKSTDCDGIIYLYSSVDPGSKLLLDEAPELCLPLIDMYYLKYEGSYCGYFVHSKAPNMNLTNSSVTSFVNGYKRNLNSDKTPEMNLVYSTKNFSAFSSLAGCNMLLRQFNNEAFLDKLSN